MLLLGVKGSKLVPSVGTTTFSPVFYAKPRTTFSSALARLGKGVLPGAAALILTLRLHPGAGPSRLSIVRKLVVNPPYDLAPPPSQARTRIGEWQMLLHYGNRRAHWVMERLHPNVTINNLLKHCGSAQQKGEIADRYHGRRLQV